MDSCCKVCQSHGVQQFLHLPNMPNTMRLLDSPLDPDPLFDLDLYLCRNCGFVFIANELPVKDFYDTTQMPTSMYPAEHLESLQQTVVDLADLTPNALIYEIGCNDGFFLQKFLDNGFRALHGIEPANHCHDQARKRGMNITHGYFNKRAAQEFLATRKHPRSVIARHVLEHIPDLNDWLAGIALLCDDETLLTIEVPDFETIVTSCQFCNIWEQHINYFDACSLTMLLARIGMYPVKIDTVPFGGGSLILHFRRTESSLVDTGNPNLAAKLGFVLTMTTAIEHIQSLLTTLACQGAVAAFGAGDRGACFINIAGLAGNITFTIDENPLKIGRYMTKSKLEICGPHFLDINHIRSCVLLPLNDKKLEYSVFERYAAFIESGGVFVELWPEKGGLYTIHNQSVIRDPIGGQA